MPFVFRIDAPRFDEFIRERESDAARAVRAAMEGVAAGVKTELRQAIIAGGLGNRLPNAVGVAVYPPGGKPSLGAAVTVFGKGDNAQMLLDVFSNGAIIRARNAKYLLVPTKEGRATGLLNALRLERQPDGSTRIKRRRLTDIDFLRRTLGHGARQVIDIVPPGKMNPKVGFVIARGVVRQRRAGGIGYRPATKRRVAQGRAVVDVVLALLLPEVRLRKRFDAQAILERWTKRVPELIERAMRKG